MRSPNKHHIQTVQTEYVRRIDGKLNVWQRRLGRYSWGHWELINVL